jgi:hypothetical protein
MTSVHERAGARKTEIIIPKRRRGRPTAEAQLAYEADVEEFCSQIGKIRANLDFEVSARGWCYILEEHGATKADFPTIERLFVALRKSGNLPLDICAEDEARAADHLEELDHETPEEFAQGWIDHVRENAHKGYNPVSLWEDSEYYIEMWVEKIDLKSLFSDLCKRYTIPLINIRGRTCLNSRAGTMNRFLERESEGKTCVLLYCGDHDPSGLDISGSILSDIEGLTGATGYDPADLVIDRFGLNADFIEAQDLSWTENLITSSGEDLASRGHPDHKKSYVQSYLAQFGARKVEANALVVRPEAGRQLCLDAIQRYTPDALLADFETRRAEAQIEAREAIGRLFEVRP